MVPNFQRLGKDEDTLKKPSNFDENHTIRFSISENRVVEVQIPIYQNVE